MSYVDGFVFPIKKDNVEGYAKMVQKAAALWLEHGALEYVECIGEDLSENEGTYSFLRLVQPKDGETIGFSYIVYESREHRDTVNAKVMADKRIAEMMDESNPLLDCKRMAYNGFVSLVHKKK